MRSLSLKGDTPIDVIGVIGEDPGDDRLEDRWHSRDDGSIP
jgi:hypothetical protein